VTFLSWLIRRWWFWVVAPVGLLGFVGFLVVWSGWLAWEREQSAARASGFPTTFAELAAVTPAFDGVRNEQLWRWQEEMCSSGWVESRLNDPDLLLRMWSAATRNSEASDQERRAEDQAEPEEMAESLATLSAWLAAGPMPFGRAGWFGPLDPAAIDGAVPDRERFVHGMGAPLGAAAVAFAEQATTGIDPLALAYLDQFAAVTRQVDSCEGAWLAAMVDAARDAAYLRLLATGQLAAPRCHAWLHEPLQAGVIAARALAGHRVLQLALIVDGSYLQIPADAWRHHSEAWRLPRRAAIWSRRLRALSATFTGGPLPDDLAQWERWSWQESGSILALKGRDLLVVARGWVNDLHQQRQIRAAGALILAWRSGALPVDSQAARQCIGPALYDGTTLLPPLVYERLSSSRFRLGIDPNGTLPAFTTRDWLQGRTTTGQPAGAGATSGVAVIAQPWSLELDCAGLPAMAPAAAPAAGAP
jgi:hypothetical protein